MHFPIGRDWFTWWITLKRSQRKDKQTGHWPASSMYLSTPEASFCLILQCWSYDCLLGKARGARSSLRQRLHMYALAVSAVAYVGCAPAPLSLKGERKWTAGGKRLANNGSYNTWTVLYNQWDQLRLNLRSDPGAANSSSTSCGLSILAALIVGVVT